MKVGSKRGLIVDCLVGGNGVVGLVTPPDPVIPLSTRVPWMLQPNRFSPADAVQWLGAASHWVMVPHEAEWKRSARYLATVKGKMTLAVLAFSDLAVPSFCWSVSSP